MSLSYNSGYWTSFKCISTYLSTPTPIYTPIITYKKLNYVRNENVYFFKKLRNLCLSLYENSIYTLHMKMPCMYIENESFRTYMIQRNVMSLNLSKNSSQLAYENIIYIQIKNFCAGSILKNYI